MKHIVTLIQVLFWLVGDCLLFVYYFKWGLFVEGHFMRNGFLKQENGIVRRANNAERHKISHKNKYKAAFSQCEY